MDNIAINPITSVIQESLDKVNTTYNNLLDAYMTSEKRINCASALLTAEALLKFTEITITETEIRLKESSEDTVSVAELTESCLIRDTNLMKEHADYIYGYLIEQESRIVNDVWVTIKSVISTLHDTLAWLTELKEEILEKELNPVV